MSESPRTVAPSLDALVTSPGTLDTLPRHVAAIVYRQVARLEADLRARLLEAAALDTDAPISEADRLVGVDEAARLLSTSADSLYRKWPKLGFAFKDPIDGRIKFRLSGVARYVEGRAR